MIGAGVGLNYTVGDFLLAGGVSFATTSSTIPGTPELENSTFSFPVWNIGGEWNLTEWLIARMGYIAVTGKATIQSPLTPTSTLENTFTFFLPPQRGFTVGVGFHLGDFSLDATINEDVLRQGLNNIGGGGQTFAYLSASYAMP
jgi:hypothetical protein